MSTIKFNPDIHPAYKQQFDKLTEAYIKNEVNPMVSCSCFVGNLLNKERCWRSPGMLPDGEWPLSISQAQRMEPSQMIYAILQRECGSLYSPAEIYLLEGMFMKETEEMRDSGSEENREDILFRAFEKTLALLRQIHESKGEAIDSTPTLTKRELVK